MRLSAWTVHYSIQHSSYIFILFFLFFQSLAAAVKRTKIMEACQVVKNEAGDEVLLPLDSKVNGELPLNYDVSVGTCRVIWGNRKSHENVSCIL